MDKRKHEHNEGLNEAIIDADDTGLVRNEANIVEEEIEEGLSPKELPVDERSQEGR
jgi:hypothetical protein